MKFLRLFVYPAVVLGLFTLTFAAPKGAPKGEKVTFNFVDIDLSTVTKFISEITGKNFIFDERVKGKITIIAPSKLSSADAFSLFTSVLELKGFTIVPSGVDAYKIIPASEAKQRGLEINTERRKVNESYMARLIPLKEISADDALRFLQPVVSKDGYISAFGPGNMLLVIDSGLNIEKILVLLDAIDQPSGRSEPELVFLKYSSAESIAKVVTEGFLKGRAKPGQPASEEVKAVADTRLNALVLFGDKGVREAMKGLIALIDVPSPEAQGRINVYFLENADATELSKVLEGLIRGKQQPAQAAGAQTSPFEAVGGISITPDKATNALVIVASPADYQSLTEVIKQLDKRRKQVYVEVMITEVSINKLLDLGTRWRAMVTSNDKPYFVTGVGQVDQATVGSIITGLSGLTVGGLGNYFTVPGSFVGSTSDFTAPGLAAIFQLSDFRGVVNVLSTPQLLTSDNKEAEILVGENRAFATKRESDPARPASIFSSIERKDVGIILRITPQITEGDYIKLDIYQEISAVAPGTLADTDIPTTTKRSTKTSVVAKDKQTVAIGGLMQEKQVEQITKVPLLGDIPVLGWLFKSKSTSKEKTNLLVFITPHVIKDSESLADLTQKKQMAFARANNQYVEGELLVKFKDEVSEDDALLLLLKQKASVIKYIDSAKIYHIKLKEKQTVEEALKVFSRLPQVEFAEPNYIVKKQDAK